MHLIYQNIAPPSKNVSFLAGAGNLSMNRRLPRTCRFMFQRLIDNFNSLSLSLHGLVLEVAYTSKYHSHVMAVAISYRILVFYRATRLNNGLYTVLACNLYTIGKGEEGV